MKPVFAIPLFLLALPMVAAEAPCQKIEGRTDFFLGKYKLNENPDYYKLFLYKGKYTTSHLSTPALVTM